MADSYCTFKLRAAQGKSGVASAHIADITVSVTLQANGDAKVSFTINPKSAATASTRDTLKRVKGHVAKRQPGRSFETPGKKALEALTKAALIAAGLQEFQLS